MSNPSTGSGRRVLVCIKRVPDTGGEITLTEDGQSVEDRHLGHTVSAHDECAVELAVEVAKDTGGEVTVLTLGSAEAVEQLRNALALGCSRAVLVEADAAEYGPADVAAAIAEVVRAHEAAGTTYDLVLVGNDASDTGDFQVGIRLAYALDRPVVAGVKTVKVSGDRALARVDAPDGGVESYEVPLPAVLTVLEGGVEPRYPTIPGRMKAKKIAIEEVAPAGSPRGPARVRLKVPPPQPSQVSVLGEGPQAAPAVVDLLESLGVVR
jgi:electron transfer flavoprotein beta subunit